jgi:purine-binding chemotaxis protein CheW
MSNPENKTNEDENEFVIFLIGGQEYCIDIMSLREIRGATTPTALPDSPAYVKGVINLRGAVVPIIDLATRLGLEPSIETERSVIMITNIGEQLMGLSADAVLDILSINPQTIQPTPTMNTQDGTRFVSGLVAMKERMISVIDLISILPPHTQEEAA